MISSWTLMRSGGLVMGRLKIRVPLWSSKYLTLLTSPLRGQGAPPVSEGVS